MIYLVIELLSSIRIFFLFMNIYICLNCCCMVSFLNIEFDCKSNNQNCGKLRTENLFSPPLPFLVISGLLYGYREAVLDCIWQHNGVLVMHIKDPRPCVYICLNKYTRHAVTPGDLGCDTTIFNKSKKIVNKFQKM